MAQPKEHYQVAISGGGIAGITLALMFEKLDISYVLLEARDTLESDRGAGIGLQPNGLRILDQLGLIEDIEEATIPLETWFSFDANGNMLASSSAMRHYRERIGYPVTFIERGKLLPIMANRIKRTECIKTSARVASIEETDEHVAITTTDGFSVTADFVIGADGIRSAVRSHIDSSLPEKNIKSADDYMEVGFATVYGMSSPTEGIAPGERFAVYRENETIIGFTGKDGIVFWFVFENLNKTYPLSECPRYTEAEAEALCQSVAHIQVTPSLQFGKIYQNRVVALKVAVEEGIAKAWHTDRAVIVGDAACKTTPAGGQGANQAIESCAVLVNELMRARKASKKGGRLSREALKSFLENYTQVRTQPAAMILQRSQMVCHALLSIPGPAATMVKEMLKLSDEDWLLRAFMALSTAAVLEDVELTARGHLYNEAVKAAQAEIQRRQSVANGVNAANGPKETKEANGVKGANGVEGTNGANGVTRTANVTNGLVKVS